MKPRIYFLFLFSFFFTLCSTAQQNRFVYIQTENKQPFYVRINNVVMSSSASGYMVIPKLKDGTYQAVIGFPKNDLPQQSFSFTLNKKDAGFLLKNLGDKGWGLINLQTTEVIMAKSQGAKPVSTAANDDDPFTQVLADVVNSPDLKKKPVVQEPVTTPATEIRTEEAVTKAVVIPVKEIIIEEPVKVVVAERKIRLLYNSKNNKGREMAYIDDSGDTIRIFIPATEKMVSVKANPSTKKAEKAAEKANEKFIDIELANPNANAKDADPIPADTVAKVTQSVSMINSDCRSTATEDDFLKLRKKMAAADNDDAMVGAAKKAFKSKCYSTAQVKNLSVLFLNDKGRYQFFDAAYPYVYDTGNFGSLQQQLTDPYFITRFQAMIRR